MQIQLISQFTCEGKEFFKTTNLKTRWDQIVLVTEGSYLFLVGAEELPYKVEKNEIIFIPAGTLIKRSILFPVSYFQMSFIAQADHALRCKWENSSFRPIKKLPFLTAQNARF